MDARASDTGEKQCFICKMTDTDVLDYGAWKTSDDCTVHYFCALLSSDILTNGADNEGIDGILVQDIHTMCKSYTKTRCAYCPLKRATLKCCEPYCSRKFHVVCGGKKRCLNEFVDPYKSYCHEHAKIAEADRKHAPDAICGICIEAMGEYDPFTSIPACCDEDFYHKRCMQKYAVKFGSLVKCPSCGQDPEGYQKFLSLRGIYCPTKDADYELSQNAFHSLLYRHKRCDADKCHCPKGRDHIEKHGDWMYSLCRFCGGAGSHAKCREDGLSGSFSCRRCFEKVEDVQSPQSATNDGAHSQSEPMDVESDSNANANVRVHEFDAEGKGKVWKRMRTEDGFKTHTYHLTNPDDESATLSFDAKQKKQIRNDRLNSFFASARFGKKPKPPMCV